jgi:hypothetical protein
MNRLGRQTPIVPAAPMRLQMRSRIALLGPDKVGKLQRVADEEDRRVVPHEVPVAVLGVELHREAAGIARGIGRSALAADG